MSKGKYARKRLRQKLKECSIHNVGFSNRIADTLYFAGIHNMADLMRESDASILALPVIEESDMEEIRKVKSKYLK